MPIPGLIAFWFSCSLASYFSVKALFYLFGLYDRVVYDHGTISIWTKGDMLKGIVFAVLLGPIGLMITIILHLTMAILFVYSLSSSKVRGMKRFNEWKNKRSKI